jgi:PAS domain S-box-containing protein
MCQPDAQTRGAPGTFEDVVARRSPGVGRREADVERARFAALVEHSGEAMVATDRDLRVTVVNPAAERLFGFAAPEAVGRPLAAILGAEAGDARRWSERLLEGQTLRFDAGSELRLAVTLAPIRDSEGDVVGAVSMSRDVTLERAASAELARGERRARLVARAAGILAASLDRTSTIAAMNRIAVPELADFSAVFGFDPETAKLELEHVAVIHPRVEAALRAVVHQPIPQRPGGLTERAALTGEAVLLRNVPADLSDTWKALFPAIAEQLAPLTASSAMVLPLRAAGSLAGFLFLASLRPDRRYDEDDLAMAVEIAHQVARTLERSRLYETALAARERFTAAFANAPVGMALIELDGELAPRIVEVNSALCQLSGFERDELVGGDPIDALLHPDDRAEARAGLAAVFRTGGGAYRAERRYLTRAGELLWVQVHVAAIAGAGGTQVVLQALDVTERLRAERALRELNQELEHRVAERTLEVRAANRELEAANRELEAFAYSAAHDLRAPLRAIDRFAEALAGEDALTPDALEYVELLRRGAGEMSSLIDALLAFSRVGVQAMALEEVEPEAVVTAVLEELESGRDVECVVGPLPAVRADRRLLALVYANLIGNALKFTQERRPARIEIGCEAGAYYVRDNGIGFDQADAGRIFDVFRRLHPVEVYEGSGVGLALVKRIVERHGGAVWADGGEGRGATFWFRLDQRDSAERARPAATRSPISSAG